MNIQMMLSFLTNVVANVVNICLFLCVWLYTSVVLEPKKDEMLVLQKIKSLMSTSLMRFLGNFLKSYLRSPGYPSPFRGREERRSLLRRGLGSQTQPIDNKELYYDMLSA